jgi:purine-nucleoside phosphorylase
METDLFDKSKYNGVHTVDNIQTTTDFLASKTKNTPEIGLITGTGLGNLTEDMDIDFRLPYKEIPYFPTSTIKGHKGNLACGRISDRHVIAMEGRFHIYEGYTPQEITFPVRVMANLGVKYLFVSSAAGGLNPEFNAGDLMILSDHINLTGSNPLIGPNMDRFGPRFPDMSKVYDPGLISLTEKKAQDAGIQLQKGVYAGITGPSLETPAETRFLKMVGADSVGMSTVLEVIAGVHCGLRIAAIVVLTNINLPDRMAQVSIEEVLATANMASSRLSALWERIIAGLPE